MLTIDVCKSTARVHTRGFSKLQLDDWMTVNSIVWYTLLIVSLNKVFFSGGSNFMTPEEEAALTPETTAERVAGSKWVLVVEEAMVMTVWTCKLSMLFLYHRMTYDGTLPRSPQGNPSNAEDDILADAVALFKTVEV